MFTGSVRIEIIGLINVFTNPSTRATNNATTNVVTEIPGTIYAVASTASVSASHFKRILIILIYARLPTTSHGLSKIPSKARLRIL